MTSSSFVKMWLRFGFLDTGWPSSPNCPGYMPIHKRVSLFSPVQHRMSGNNYLQHYISRRVTFPQVPWTSSISLAVINFGFRIKGWESIQLSFAGRLQLIKSVLMSLNVYWAMAFILPKGVIREWKKRCVPSCGKETQQWDIQRWHGCGVQTDRGRRSRNPGYPCPQQSTYESPPLECDPEQPVVHLGKWIAHTRLRHKSVWTVDVKGALGVGGRFTIKIRTSSLY
ncbi:UNVERIFIED_CONTAM: hypothetical protein Sradi_0159700 [Sesamum radiatum]|uniref:Uncharacterized protein n=1 Tax=Sesamum radiatum TaxID=300843 RepID=A0AAW2WL05_SESRA